MAGHAALPIPLIEVLAGLQEGVLVNGPSGEVLYANEALAAMLGWSPAEMVGRHLFDFMDDEGRALSQRKLAERAHGVAERFDFPFVGRDGARVWTLVAARPALDTEGKHVGSLVVVTDIRERKAAEQALAAAHDQLEARVAERTEALEALNDALRHEIAERKAAERSAHEASRAKSRFLANMSHELRTPLNAIIGYTELVLEGPDLPVATVASDLERVLGSAKHLLDMIHDVLDLSRVEAGKLPMTWARVAPDTLVMRAVEIVADLLARGGNRVELDLAELPPLIRTDELRARQVLVNLLSNAAKFTRDGVITVHARVEGRRVAFAVTDTGLGIPPEQLRRIFEPFHQVDPSSTRQVGGTGLGLAISRRFASVLGGDITVDSEPGRGSTFTFTIPIEPHPTKEAR